jgi:hypothetical protein
MRVHWTLLTLLTLLLSACGARHPAPQALGSPIPVTGPRQAPLVHVLDALEVDSLLGRRVRVVGRCVAAGQGRRAGSWTLADSGATIEVRGLVPSSCAASEGENLTIFAQIEPISGDSRARLLLRLPD